MAMSQRYGIAKTINNQESRQYYYSTTRVPPSYHVDTGRGNRSQSGRSAQVGELVIVAMPVDYFARHRLILYHNASGGLIQEEEAIRDRAMSRRSRAAVQPEPEPR